MTPAQTQSRLRAPRRKKKHGFRDIGALIDHVERTRLRRAIQTARACPSLANLAALLDWPSAWLAEELALDRFANDRSKMSRAPARAEIERGVPQSTKLRPSDAPQASPQAFHWWGFWRSSQRPKPVAAAILIFTAVAILRFLQRHVPGRSCSFF